MGDKKGKNTLRMAFLLSLCMGILSGCGKEKTVDYTIEGIAETVQPPLEAAKSGIDQFAGEEVWVETWDNVKIGETEWDGVMLDTIAGYDVDAKIILPQAKQMSVIEVKEPEFDAEFRRTMAENIFGTDGIYYGDVAHMTKRDLQEIQNYIAKGSTVSMTPLRYGFSVNVNKEKYENLYDALEHIEDAPETYTQVAEYNTDEYLGTYEGQMYRLIFGVWPPDSSNEYRSCKKITLMVKNLYEVCPEDVKEVKNLVCSAWTMGDWVENECALSEEEALKEAEAFVEKLGLDYTVHSYTYPLLWGTPPQYVTEDSVADGWCVNGYVFYFDLGVDGISFVNYGTEEEYYSFGENADKNAKYSMVARLQIYVTDKGVIKMVADNPVEIINISEDVKLLPLDTVKSIMKESASTHWDALSFWGNGGYGNCFDEMELLYFRISDKENPGRYSYVPAWRLGAVTRYPMSGKIRIDIPILINAIDGSFINFGDET